MSNWKKEASRIHDQNSSYSTSKHQKFNPKKLSKHEQDPTRFYNLTFGKKNHSVISQEKQKVKDRSFVDMDKSFQMTQPRVLKASSSQIKLSKEHIQQPRNSGMYGSFMLNIPDDYDTRGRGGSLNLNSKKIDKNLLYNELQKLKKQFSAFQNIILNELRKQQKYINQMLENIIHSLQRQDFGQIELEQPTKSNNIFLEVASPYTHKSSNNIFNHTQVMEVKISQQITKMMKASSRHQISINYDGKINSIRENMKKEAFRKFFKAVENLKKDMKELNELSDVSGITSPNNSLEKAKWDKWSEYIRTES